MPSFYETVKDEPLIIADVINCLGFGKEEARNISRVAKHLCCSDGKTEVKVRKLIRDAILLGYPIGSCSKSYFLISNQDEFDTYIESLNGRIIGIRNRIHALKYNWYQKEQMELSL